MISVISSFRFGKVGFTRPCITGGNVSFRPTLLFCTHMLYLLDVTTMLHQWMLGNTYIERVTNIAWQSKFVQGSVMLLRLLYRVITWAFYQMRKL